MWLSVAHIKQYYAGYTGGAFLHGDYTDNNIHTN